MIIKNRYKSIIGEFYCKNKKVNNVRVKFNGIIHCIDTWKDSTMHGCEIIFHNYTTDATYKKQTVSTPTKPSMFSKFINFLKGII